MEWGMGGRRASPGEGPSKPLSCSSRTPPSHRSRPSTSLCASAPIPTRKSAGPRSSPSAMRRSSGMVILMFASSPGIGMTGYPAPSTREASSVPCLPSSCAFLTASRRIPARNPWGVWESISSDRSRVRRVLSPRSHCLTVSRTGTTGTTAPCSRASSTHLSRSSSETNGRTASCTRMISASSGTAVRAFRTESCLCSPPSTTARTFSTERYDPFPSSGNVGGRTSTIPSTRADAAIADKVLSRRGRPPRGGNCLGRAPPIRLPSPPATMIATTLVIDPPGFLWIEDFRHGDRKRRRCGNRQRRLQVQEAAQVRLHHFLRNGARDRDFLDQEGTCRVEHLPLPEREDLFPLEKEKVAQDLGDFEGGPGLELVHVLAIPPVPGLGFDPHFAVLENLVDGPDGLGVHDPPETDLLHVAHRDHDRHARVENAENVEGFLLSPRDRFRFDCLHHSDTLGRVDSQIPHFEIHGNGTSEVPIRKCVGTYSIHVL